MVLTTICMVKLIFCICKFRHDTEASLEQWTEMSVVNLALAFH